MANFRDKIETAILKKIYLLVSLLISLSVTELLAQKNVRTFIFGHSLIHHEIQVNPTPSQETSVPHWFHFLAAQANHSYQVSGQYGFLPQHANLPPIAQWGFDFVAGAWDSDNEPFSQADFTNILITPGNFVQWQGPSINYPNESVSPLSATESIFNWCTQEEDSLTFYIYENWPDMGGYLSNGFPPSNTEWDNYNTYLLGDFHDWFLEYHDLLDAQLPNATIKMIPVGPAISNLLAQAPYDQIAISTLYEDDAPHGRPTIYFLSALLTYMAMYEEKAPASYQVDNIIDPIIANNYQAVVDFLWNELQAFNYADGSSRVFSDSLISSYENDLSYQISISPNPGADFITIEGLDEEHTIQLYNMQGQVFQSDIPINSSNKEIKVQAIPAGLYILIGKNRSGQILYRKKFVKQ